MDRYESGINKNAVSSHTYEWPPTSVLFPFHLSQEVTVDNSAQYQHLTNMELISLLLQQEMDMQKQQAASERQEAQLHKCEAELKKVKLQVRDLEDYIDNLLLRIMEQTPTLLQVRTRHKWRLRSHVWCIAHDVRYCFLKRGCKTQGYYLRLGSTVLETNKYTKSDLTIIQVFSLLILPRWCWHDITQHACWLLSQFCSNRKRNKALWEKASMRADAKDYFTHAY